LGLLVAATIVVEGGRSIHDRPAAAPGFAVIQSATMRDLEVGRLRIGAVVETAGPTRPTWLFPAATPEAQEAQHKNQERARAQLRVAQRQRGEAISH